MFSVSLVVIALLGFALVVLGIGVFLTNTRNPLNQLFFYFALSVATWLTINYLSADTHISHEVSLWSNRFVLVVGGTTLFFLLAFILQLTNWISKAKWFKYLLGVLLASWVACLTPYVVQDVFIEKGQVANSFGVLYGLYFIPLFFTAIATTVVLLMAHYRLSGLLRVQVDNISKSILIVVPVVIFGNAILPLQGDYRLVSYAPLSLILVVIMMAYVIIRHRLFNIRLLIVRSVAYVFSLGILVVLYALGVHYVMLPFSGLHNSFLNAVINIAVIVVIITAYQPIKRAFDKITNRIFYKDAYEPQLLFDQLNKMLVSSLDVKYLMMQSVSVVEAALKPEYALIGLGQGDTLRIFSSHKLGFSKQVINKVRRMTPMIDRHVIAVDYLEDDAKSELHDLMRANDLSVVVQLTQDVRKNEESLGCLVLGPRKSGNPYTPQDLRVLETVANVLIIAIQNALHFEEIQKFNVTLQQRIEDATRKLQRTNAKLEALDEIKDDFISMASHQLRTPLTSVKGYISMVLDGDAGNISLAQRKMLAQAFISSQRMVYLIADLLNVSRLKTGKFVIESTPVNLAKLVAEEVAPLVETAKARGINLTYAKPKNFPQLMLDETKTRQVIMNFVDNAIYYTRSSGHIDVQLVDKPSTVELKVVDNGIGVPAAEQHHLFTKFYRARNAQRARPDGTGLGLFMAKKVILGQGGAIIFESREGKGSVFGFTFAKSRLAVPASPISNPSTSVKTPARALKQPAGKA